MTVSMFSWFSIQNHVLVKGTASPDDPMLRDYWQHRQVMHAQSLSPSHQKLAKTQNYRCPVCEQGLLNDEALEVHHRHSRITGGNHHYDNLILVHLYCHQQLTAQQR